MQHMNNNNEDVVVFRTCENAYDFVAKNLYKLKSTLTFITPLSIMDKQSHSDLRYDLANAFFDNDLFFKSLQILNCKHLFSEKLGVLVELSNIMPLNISISNQLWQNANQFWPIHIIRHWKINNLIKHGIRQTLREELSNKMLTKSKIPLIKLSEVATVSNGCSIAMAEIDGRKSWRKNIDALYKEMECITISLLKDNAEIDNNTPLQKRLFPINGKGCYSVKSIGSCILFGTYQTHNPGFTPISFVGEPIDCVVANTVNIVRVSKFIPEMYSYILYSWLKSNNQLLPLDTACVSVSCKDLESFLVPDPEHIKYI